jgi:hypothetical protein
MYDVGWGEEDVRVAMEEARDVLGYCIRGGLNFNGGIVRELMNANR